MTGRLPFDPSRMKSNKRAGAEGEIPSASGAFGSGADRAISVSQLAAKIDSALKSTIRGRIVVLGEISSLTHRTHWYFSLKDSNAVVGAVVFASVARKINYTPKHGDSVLATGRLEFYAPSGRVSFIVESMIPVGEGELERRYRALCDELRALEWFDPLTKKMLPSFPRRVAVVTSRTSAALQDVINTMGKRCPAVDLLVVDVRVQGDSAGGQIQGALRELNRRQHELGIDAVLLTRGGGSMEDLWAFNEIGVAQAIHESALPVVAAIGHESDTTIAELVADERCATPTQAAMKLTPDRDALGEQLDSIQHRLRAGVEHSVRYQRQTLDRLAGSRALTSPKWVIQIHRDQIGAVERQLAHVVRAKLISAHRRVDGAMLNLARQQPVAVHARRSEHLDGLHRALRRGIRTRTERMRDQLGA
ncbi:MAG: exodeoxyribonuclease VII large subunit, partial [Phycisphaerales bacterium]|nr:exodeoxyribonuclease VII large subunit [Phycisphaerales bacterium]